MPVKKIDHPLLRHKVGLMREAGISSKKFRELASEVGNLLTYEAAAELETEQVEIESWTGDKLMVDRIKGKKITPIQNSAYIRLVAIGFKNEFPTSNFLASNFLAFSFLA